MAQRKKNVLGRGISALIPENIEEESKKSEIEIDINSIYPNENQPRKNFDEERINELAQSIKEHGVIQPLIVAKDGEFYKIIAGERRWRAAKVAGLKKVPIIVKDLTDTEVMEISLIENLQREDLNPVEEAKAYKALMDEYKLTQEDISKKIGKARSSITNSIRILNLDEKVLSYIVDGTLSEGHGKALLSIEDKNMQYEIAKKIIDGGLNVRQTEQLVKTILKGKNKKVKDKKKDIYIQEIESKLENTFGTKVTINKGRKKGKIEIEYYSDDDFQRIIDKLSI